MFQIFGLIDAHDVVYFVGKSNNPKRRMRELKTEMGFRPDFIVLEVCGADWREVAQRWVKHFRDGGQYLLNGSDGGLGLELHTPEAKAKLSAIGKGRPKPEGFGERVAALQRGVPRDWSPEGAARVAENQYRPGENSLDRLSPETLALRSAKISKAMSDLPTEERSRRNRVGWSAMTPEQRAERGRNIAEAQRASGRVAAANQAPEKREASSRGSKAFWANMTPEYRADYLARRQAARAAKHKP